MRFDLPYPPSVNHYYILVNNRKVLGKRGREYREEVERIVSQTKCKTLEGRLSVSIRAHMPDRRKRDIDNVLKCLLDSMEKAGVFLDDSQIDRLVIQRCPVIKGGLISISIEEIPDGR